MKNNDLIGLSPFWLIGLSLALTLTLVVGVPMVFGPIDGKAWLAFGGSFLGGVCAIVAVAVATSNVNRQLRINLISREEERIERELPRLRKAHEFFHILHISLVAAGTQGGRKILAAEYDAGRSEASLQNLLKKKLPLADIETLDYAEFAIEEAYEQVGEAEASSNEIRIIDAHLDLVSIEDSTKVAELRRQRQFHLNTLIQAEMSFETTKSGILERANSAGEKIETFEKRLISFRRILEKHFDT